MLQKNKNFATFSINGLKLFYLYIYPPDLQKSEGSTIHRASSYYDLLLENAKILLSGCNVLYLVKTLISLAKTIKQDKVPYLITKLKENYFWT